MKLIIISLFVFLVIMYVYTYKRYKKIKKNNVSTVEEFRKKYLKKELPDAQDTNKANNYITKYNSSVDYIEKNTFIREASDSKAENDLF